MVLHRCAVGAVGQSRETNTHAAAAPAARPSSSLTGLYSLSSPL